MGDKLDTMKSPLRCLANTSKQVRYVFILMALFTIGIFSSNLINVYLLHWGNVEVHLQVSSYDATNASMVLHHIYSALPAQQRKFMVSSIDVVPNIVHFIWFSEDGRREMSFLNYISIRSAHQIQKPDTIMLHCNHLPAGEWWQRLWREVPLKIVYRQPPNVVHGQTLANVHHKGDIAKFQVLIEYGGIYLDYDVIVVNNLDPLRKYDATMGKEKPPKLIAGIIVGRHNATFLRLLLESYRDNYRWWDWDYNCAIVAYRLAEKRPDLVHIEAHKLTTPDWLDRHKLWNDVIEWRDLYVVHVMAHFEHSSEVYTPLNIRNLNTTFGQIMRYIYYGSSNLI